MKLTLFLVVLSLFQVSASVYSQTQRLTIKLSNASVKEALNEIEEKSDVKFLYKDKSIENRQVSIDVRDVPLNEILDEILGKTGNSYRLMDNNLIIISPQEILQPGTNTDLSGKVTNTAGEPVVGVTVIIKGTTRGIITDADGNYMLSGIPSDATLVFSFIGMKTREVPVSGKTTINVVLEEEAIGIEEVVAIGYGTMRKSDLTGTVSRVTPDKTLDLPNSNILQALKGNVAGLNIGTPDRPGEDPSLSIRGTNSISASNAPLIVVDGIIFNGSLNSINTNDVESVDVLKDASAAAVYGSRSANGIIIITTKKGTSGKPVFNFSAKYGISGPVKLIDMLDGPGYIQKVLDFRRAKGYDADIDQIGGYLSLTEADNYEAGKTIDWSDELIKPRQVQNYNLSISGSTPKTNYYISGAWYNEKGIVENDNYKRITARTNFTNYINNWFTVTVKSSFSHLDYSGVQVPLSIGLSPYSNFYEDEEIGILQEYPMEDSFFTHPYMTLSIDNSDVQNDLWGLISSEIEIPFVKGLKWTMNYSLNGSMRKFDEFRDNTIAKTSNGSANKNSYENYNWLLDNILGYRRTFNDHAVDATVLYSREYQRSANTIAHAADFFSQAMGYNNLGIGGVQTVSSDYGDQNGVSYMGRLNYIYKGKYALTATIRRDGFSGFSEGHKYGTFRSGAFAWTASNEEFLNTASWLSLLKLRFSYGENGNQAINRYATLARMSTVQAVFGDGATTTTGVYVSSMANSELGWETTKVFNTGFDLGLFKNRLNATADIYFSKTDDLLLERKIPSMTGFSKTWTNIGEVSNKGFELSLNSINIKTADFRWETGFAFDLNRNRIEKLYGEDLDGDGKEDDDVSNNWFIGESLGVFFGYDIDGIYQNDDTDIPEGYRAGDFRIVDRTGEGEISAEDRYIYGNRRPNFKFSVSNTFRYKNLSLYIMINSIQGGGKNKYYQGDNMMLHNPNNQFASWSERFNIPRMDYWTPDNPSNTASRIDYVAPREHTYLEDRSFVRIQDVNLAYSFNKRILNRLQLEDLRLFINAKNLCTFTKWNGYDPENASTWVGNSESSDNNYPMLRTFSIGIDMKF